MSITDDDKKRYINFAVKVARDLNATAIAPDTICGTT